MGAALSSIASFGSTHCLIDRKTGRRTPFLKVLRAVLLYDTWPGRLLLRLPPTWWLLTAEHKRIAKFASSPQSKSKIKPMIKTYKIDPTDAERPVEDYATLQDFFTRELKEGARHVAAPNDPSVAVVPCDSRAVVYPSVKEATRLWIKGSGFNVPALLGPGYSRSHWREASIVVTRLSPADCHRLHAPVAGRVVRINRLGTRFMASIWVAVHSVMNVMTENERLVMEFDTEAFGPVVMAMIGASDVGSVQPLVKEGQTVRKGDEVGVFQYGGSIVATVFRPGAIEFDADLRRNTERGCETRTEMGTSLGRAVGAPAGPGAGQQGATET